MPETTTAAQRGAGAGSLRELGRHGPAVLAVLALTAGGSLYFYTFTTYMQKFLVLTAQFDKSTTTLVTTLVLIPFMALQPLFGALADRVGRRVNLLLFAALATLCTVPLLTALAAVRSAPAAFGLLLAALAINAIYTSISGLFKAELFPVHVRALGVGLSYGVANALFGGTAESVALAFKHGGVEHGYYWYVTAVCAVSLLAALWMRDTRQANALRDIEA